MLALRPLWGHCDLRMTHGNSLDQLMGRWFNSNIDITSMEQLYDVTISFDIFHPPMGVIANGIYPKWPFVWKLLSNNQTLGEACLQINPIVNIQEYPVNEKLGFTVGSTPGWGANVSVDGIRMFTHKKNGQTLNTHKDKANTNLGFYGFDTNWDWNGYTTIRQYRYKTTYNLQLANHLVLYQPELKPFGDDSPYDEASLQWWHIEVIAIQNNHPNYDWKTI